MKQICHGVGLVINRYFEEASLFVAFYHEFKHFLQFSVNWAEYFLAVHHAVRVECYATFCLQDKISAMFTRKTSSCAVVKNLFIDVAMSSDWGKTPTLRLLLKMYRCYFATKYK